MQQHVAQRQLDRDVEAVVSGNTAFALDLYGRLKELKGNLFFSPLSISSALAMTYAGADGDTERQMAQALHFTLSREGLHPAFASLQARLDAVQAKGKVRLSVANSLWPQEGYAFLETFLDLVKMHYGALITPVDYGSSEAARTKINAWVEHKTEDKIKDLIRPGVLDALTRLVLVNAIYFKGDWASQFDKQHTKDAPFWVASGVQVNVPMMAQTESFRYAEEDGSQILELPYAGRDLSMIVLLPQKITGLAEIENATGAANLTKWLRRLEKTEIRVFLPRFKTSSGFWLNEPLIAMGMIDAFDMLKADFARMDGRHDWLFMAAAIHKAFVDVNEEGTEAAAATAVAVKARAASEPPVFRADHPFLFLIRDNQTQSILFLGRVVNPTIGGQ